MIRKKILLVLVSLVVLGFALPCFGGSITYEYDDLYRLIKTIYPDGTVIEYTYDAAGNRLRVENRPGDSDGDGIPDNEDLCPSENPGDLDFNADGCLDSQQVIAEDMQEHITATFTAVVDQILADPAIPDAAAEEIEDALEDIIGKNNGKANNGAADKLRDGKLIPCLTKVKKAVQDLQDAADEGYDTQELQTLVTSYACAAVLLAITEAAAALGQTHPDVVKATQFFEQGDALFTSGDFLGAIAKYKKAARPFNKYLFPFPRTPRGPLCKRGCNY